MTTYPDEAYTPVMDFYGNLPENLKRSASKILEGFRKKYQEGEAPPEEMLSSLKSLTNAHKGGLEAKVEKPSSGIGSLAEGVGKMFSGPQLVPLAATAMILLYLL